MHVDGYTFMADTVAKFHHSVYVTGWFRHDHDGLASASMIGPGIVAQVARVGLVHPSVEPEVLPGRAFTLQAVREETTFPDDLGIAFVTHAGRRIEANLLALSAERLAQSATARLYHQFIDMVMGMDRPRVIDIGGRNRSDYDRGRDFPGTSYVVVDILPGENVDIVADAHALSDHLAPESADAVIAAATFEHLLMPWKAVVEINRVLKPGGIACVISHQTLGLHDMPWDFWRFSADAWDALFNRYTGFEILERAMAQEQFVIPFFYRHAMDIAEKSAGFEFSGVIARKIGPARVDWPVPLAEIISTRYPTDGDDGRRRARWSRRAREARHVRRAVGPLER